jgi:hypothetical protein|eukprot:1855563-Prymnesium_polylepis.1
MGCGARLAEVENHERACCLVVLPRRVTNHTDAGSDRLTLTLIAAVGGVFFFVWLLFRALTRQPGVKKLLCLALGFFAAVAYIVLRLTCHALTANTGLKARESLRTSTIYIIRHGEKTSRNGCLNDRGKARANSLLSTFSGKPSPGHRTFLQPTSLFANHYDDIIDCERCRQTLQPISTALSLPIVFAYGFVPWEGGNQLAASAIRDASLSSPVILVAWESQNIQYLTAHLRPKGVHPELEWL